MGRKMWNSVNYSMFASQRTYIEIDNHRDIYEKRTDFIKFPQNT